MKHALSLGILAALLAGPTAARAELVAFGSLPEATPTLLPEVSARPDEVAASSRVAGIFPSSAPASQRQHMPQGTFYVRLFSTEAQAEEHTRDTMRSSFERQEGETCFQVAEHWFMQQPSRRWPLNGTTDPTLHGARKGSPAARHNHEPAVRAVHAEKLVVDPAGTASVQVTDAWVDPTTLGVRLIAGATMRYARVAEAAGVTVFAARDPGRGAVHFVVHRAPSDSRVDMFVGRHMQIRSGVTGGHSSCNHASFTLEAAAGGGEQVTVELETLLGVEEMNAPSNEQRSGLLGLLRGGGEPHVPTEVRVRTLRVHLSVSQSSQDQAPVVSASFGWGGKERRMQI